MVKRPELDFDEELLGRKKPQRQRGGSDNALAVSMVLAVAMLALLILTSKNENWWAVFMLGLLFIASEAFPLSSKPSGKMSLALLPLVMAMMISGPLGCAVVSLFGLPVYLASIDEEGWRKVVFNCCQLCFASGAAAWVFHHVGGEILKANLGNAGGLVLPWLVAVLVFYVFNTLLVTPVLAPQGERMTRFWQRRLLPKLPGYLLYGGIGFLAAITYVRLEYPAVILLFMPLLAVRMVYTRYGKMRDVCDNTTLAVVEAVEGRGMFTEGHSLGVADMAVAIAEEMNFDDDDIHFLKQAALLHDIGKLALDPSLVDKPGVLTPEEYEEIKRHPLIGANIVSQKGSFSVVAPIIRHHHEMVDGSGYVDGLSGEAIPLGARILAVADTYDAMQRDTSYRKPLEPYQAAAEVIRSKGIQFDPEVVDAFITVVTNRGVWTGSRTDKVSMPEVRETAGEVTAAGEEQPTLEEAALSLESAGAGEKEKTATPIEGIKYTAVREHIEKDIRDWERQDFVGRRGRARREPRRRAPRKEKGRETPPEE